MGRAIQIQLTQFATIQAFQQYCFDIEMHGPPLISWWHFTTKINLNLSLNKTLKKIPHGVAKISAHDCCSSDDSQ